MERVPFLGIILFLLVLVSLQCADARYGTMKLLSVSEAGTTLIGNIADVSLDIEKGKGRVFLETVPLTKIDTQLSTKFAKEIACKSLELDCSELDFIYTIRADSSVIGGPSAGAALAVLTISLLEEINLNPNATLTGTINSGGFIGAVGGLKAKIDAAKNGGLTKVLIPAGERSVQDGNNSIDLVEYGKDQGLEVIEVFSLEDAVYHLTGEKLWEDEGNLSIDMKYKDTMRLLAEQLCNRTQTIQQNLMEITTPEISITEDKLELELDAIKLFKNAKESIAKNNYYSAASFCFSANFKYGDLVFRQKNLSDDDVNEQISELIHKLQLAENETEKQQINTITDLQTYMVVKERLLETQENIDEILKQNHTLQEKYNLLAFANERMDSAYKWATFFNFPGTNISKTTNNLPNLCDSKISEAEDRYTYVTIFIPENFLKKTKEDLELAKEDNFNNRHALCILRASQVTAEINTIITSMTLTPDNIPKLVDMKLDLARKNIAKSIARGDFPIVGYSYYEYSGALKSFDPFLAVRFSDYALEISSMDLNTVEKKKPDLKNIDVNYLFFFIEGVGLGMLISLIIMRLCLKKMNKNRDLNTFKKV